ncbi:MAG: hypothetical protein RR970_02425 [Hafnia sp.]
MAMEMVGLGAIAAYLGKDGLAKLLGPTADYLGGELKDFAQKRIENIGNIFVNASGKIPSDKYDSGAVSPKVLRNILNEGSYSSDALGIEYFGGILASSKSEVGRDDRGSRLALKVSSLTSYQLRVHFILYSALISCYQESGVSLDTDRHQFTTFIALPSFMELMDFNDKELEQVDSIFSHAFSGLVQEGLILERYSYGPKKYLNSIDSRLTDDGVVFVPTIAGIELFLWAFGKGEKNINYILSTEFKPKFTDFDVSKIMAKKVV